MLADNPAVATIPVRSLRAARRFYSTKLELPLIDERPGVLTYQTGGTRLFVYESASAGGNKATAATWAVKEIEAVVARLAERGVAFEHYVDLPDLTIQGDLHVGGDMKVAWAKDPDGNILSFVSD